MRTVDGEADLKWNVLIQKRFVSTAALAERLTTYNGAPAVFSSEAPGDEQDGWGGETQYPMVTYNYDLQANEERNSAGSLSVSIFCQNTADISPEDIAPIVKECLRDVILLPEGGTPYCFTWARTDAFTMGEDAGKAGVVIGCEVRFDILEYPSMETSEPDPVMAVDKYIKELYPECLVMGYDRMEEITEASADQPVVYCRLISSEKQEETNTVAWMDGRVAVHVLCPESTVRLKMAADIANHLSLDGEVIMLDYSPMFIKRLQVNYKSDYLKEGQVFITGHYGLLRYKAKPHVLMAAHGNYS